ncbi:Peroxisomal membrane protein PEX14-like protein [Drosera capensis]
MATQSTPPQGNPADPKSPYSDEDASAKEAMPQNISSESVFVNTQPIREDQVQNAVQFLSHPKVRGSPVIHRRNFLERKGLTKEEIDEAFRRVPDPSPDYTSTQATSSNQANGQLKPSSNIQQQTPAQALQPGATTSPGIVSTLTRRFHWYHMLLGIGFLAASGAGTVIFFKATIIPRLKSWIRKVAFDHKDDVDERTASRPSLAEEAAAAAKAAAAAAADVAKASQEMLITKNEEKKCFEVFMNLLDVQLQELKSMKNAVQKLEACIRGLEIDSFTLDDQNKDTGQTVGIRLKKRVSAILSLAQRCIGNTTAEFRSQSVRTSSPAAPALPAEPPHPKSYMEIMAMVQRGEKPPNVREINDLPPNPNQLISNPSLAPRTKPWEVSVPPSASSFTPRPQFINEGSSSTAQTNGVSYDLNGSDRPVPWWQQQQQQKNIRITEIESEDGFTRPSNGTTAMDHPPQRKWVPPQAPPVALPEAAIAIRQPKSIPGTDRVPDRTTRPVDGIDGPESLIPALESVQLEVNGSGEPVISSSSEIQENEQVTG